MAVIYWGIVSFYIFDGNILKITLSRNLQRLLLYYWSNNIWGKTLHVPDITFVEVETLIFFLQTIELPSMSYDCFQYRCPRNLKKWTIKSILLKKIIIGYASITETASSLQRTFSRCGGLAWNSMVSRYILLFQFSFELFVIQSMKEVTRL